MESPRARIYIQFALAKEYEDLGNSDQPFHHLKQACNLQRSQMEYDVRGDVQTMKEIMQHFDRQYFSRAKPGFPGKDPSLL